MQLKKLWFFLDVCQGDIFRYSITILFIPYSCIKLTRAIILTTQPEYLPFHPPPPLPPTSLPPLGSRRSNVMFIPYWSTKLDILQVDVASAEKLLDSSWPSVGTVQQLVLQGLTSSTWASASNPRLVLTRGGGIKTRNGKMLSRVVIKCIVSVWAAEIYNISEIHLCELP